MGMFGLPTDNNTKSANATRPKSVAEIAQERKHAADIAKKKAAKEAAKNQSSSLFTSPFAEMPNPLEELYASWSNNIQTENFSDVSTGSSFGHGSKYVIKSDNPIVNRALSQVGHM